MVEAFENCRISNLEGLVTLTSDRVILHTVVHHSSTSKISLKSKKLFVDGRMYVRMHRRAFKTGFIGSTLSKSRPKIGKTEY